MFQNVVEKTILSFKICFEANILYMFCIIKVYLNCESRQMRFGTKLKKRMCDNCFSYLHCFHIKHCKLFTYFPIIDVSTVKLWMDKRESLAFANIIQIISK